MCRQIRADLRGCAGGGGRDWVCATLPVLQVDAAFAAQPCIRRALANAHAALSDELTCSALAYLWCVWLIAVPSVPKLDVQAEQGRGARTRHGVCGQRGAGARPVRPAAHRAVGRPQDLRWAKLCVFQAVCGTQGCRPAAHRAVGRPQDLRWGALLLAMWLVRTRLRGCTPSAMCPSASPAACCAPALCRAAS